MNTVRNCGLVLLVLFLGLGLLVNMPNHVTSVRMGTGTFFSADSEGPILVLSIDPEQPRELDEPVVTILATDADGVDTVILSYWTSSSGNWVNVTAEESDSSTFTASLPPTLTGTNVTYRAYANDTLGNWGVSDTYSYITGEWDQEGPEIVLWSAPDEPEPGDEIIAYAMVGDPSGVSEVLLSKSNDGTTWVNMTMEYDEETITYSLNLGPVYEGEALYFKIYACDNLGNWAESETIVISFVAGTTSSTTSSTTTTTTTDNTSVNGGINLGSLPLQYIGGAGVAVAVVIVLLLRLRK